MTENIAVIFGGASNENEISVITGTMAVNVLKSAGYAVTPVYISQDNEIYCDERLGDIANFSSDKYRTFPRAIFANGGVYTLNKRSKPKNFIKVDVALNCCHGGFGEGGGISGLCAVLGIPLASAGVFESAVFMDKYLTKLILSSLGVKTAKYAYVTKSGGCHGDMPPFPVIVKPVSLGSSIGVEKADNEEQLAVALESALIYDSAAIVEEYFSDRREINCAAYYSEGKVIISPCEEALVKGGIFSYDDKYRGKGASAFPAELPEDISSRIRDTAAEVYSKLNMRGIVRFDFIICDGEIYLSEVNTVPGSLSYYLLSGGFKDFAGILKKVILQAKQDFKDGQNKKLIKTGILENLRPNACKIGRK
ncbi:MAG: ATP-grasp domain-containing protein [Clostridia bacterium]|nr:ATP-grasp domain-containing protein [Clostridia bacterium]